jgi:hypothetical protein
MSTTPPVSVKDFLAGLKNVRKRGDQYRARCPAHKDENPSLSIKEDGGRILVKCHAGCATENICSALGLRTNDLFLSCDQVIPANRKKIVACYDYRDENGELQYQIVRYDPKDFRLRRPDGAGGWDHRLGGVKRVLYRLAELLAVTTEELVFIPEGEKDVDRLRQLGLAATTNPFGAGKWRETYNESLRGRQVVILPDNDEQGTNHAEQIARSLRHVAASVRVVKLPGLLEKGDVCDWLDAGGTPEKLIKLTKSTQHQATTMASVSSAAELLAREFPEPKWAVPEILPEGVTILAAPPKKGKTKMALDISVAVASGGRALGTIPVERGDVLYLALEDGPKRLQQRLRSLLAGGSVPPGLDLATEWPKADAGGVEAIEQWLKEHPGARLIVIDTLKRIRPREQGNSRLYDTDYDALAPLGDLAHKYGVCILVIHHTRKAGSDDPLDLISGSFGLSGAADGALVLKKSHGQSEATLYATGRDFEDKELALQWDKEINGWKLLGDAAEYRRGKERQEIINLLRQQNTPLTPKEIAEALERQHSATKKLLWTMARDGELRADKGRYSIPHGNSGNPVTDSTESPVNGELFTPDELPGSNK